MPSGSATPAAGRPTPGPLPSSASTTTITPPRTPHLISPISNRHTRKIACCAGCHCSARSSSRHTLDPASTISNPHRMQLKFAVTLANSSRSLFLIVPSPGTCPGTQLHSPGGFGGIGMSWLCPVSLPVQDTPAISNRPLVRLEFVVSRPESITSLFLIDASWSCFSRPFSLTAPPPTPSPAPSHPTSTELSPRALRISTRPAIFRLEALNEFSNRYPARDRRSIPWRRDGHHPRAAA
jgi:hypothetical protein